MKRTPTDVLGRSFENVVANWPLLLLRVAESIIMVLLAIGSIAALVVPFAMWAGLRHFDFGRPPDAIVESLTRALVDHWLMLVGILVYALLVFAVMLAIHAFVQGGAVLIYIDGEKKAGQGVRAADQSPRATVAPGTPATGASAPAAAGIGRERFATFSAQRWIEGGRRLWWRIFWIYNIAGGAICTIILVPLLVVLLLVLALRDAGTGVLIGISCLAVVATLGLATVALIVISVWSERAIVDCAVSDAGAAESVRLARLAIRNDLGRHLAIAAIIMAISFAASMLSGGLTGFARIPHNLNVSLLFAPVQIVSSLVNSAISAIVAGWFLAAFTSLATERE